MTNDELKEKDTELRKLALQYAPTHRTVKNGNNQLGSSYLSSYASEERLTAKEIVKEAEEIYKFLKGE